MRIQYCNARACIRILSLWGKKVQGNAPRSFYFTSVEAATNIAKMPFFQLHATIHMSTHIALLHLNHLIGGKKYTTITPPIKADKHLTTGVITSTVLKELKAWGFEICGAIYSTVYWWCDWHSLQNHVNKHERFDLFTSEGIPAGVFPSQSIYHPGNSVWPQKAQ